MKFISISIITILLIALTQCTPCSKMDCGTGECKNGECKCKFPYYGEFCELEAEDNSIGAEKPKNKARVLFYKSVPPGIDPNSFVNGWNTNSPAIIKLNGKQQTAYAYLQVPNNCNLATFYFDLSPGTYKFEITASGIDFVRTYSFPEPICYVQNIY
jgi:hypothetical protein